NRRREQLFTICRNLLHAVCLLFRHIWYPRLVTHLFPGSPKVRMARILLVEDDANVRMLLEHVLRGEGHDVDPTATVQQALSRLQQRGYDLVVADGKLPDGTGMTVGDAATADGVRTLIVTGFALQLPREELMRF